TWSASKNFRLACALCGAPHKAHYPERGFIRSTVHEVSVRMRQRAAAALKINPDAFSTSWHPIDPGRRMHSHGHSVLQVTSTRRANGPGHHVCVARRSHHQREQCAAIPAMD